ncbi:D-2-hydroxyacid dehydrogenase [Thalassotalea sp. Y01]|uniref:D-2-hydroxyacid dehydrogenase n=1 Tax=Thalassotalea sp. Y01 TaxID=2729613 RepID=UPI00145E5BA0|nr:D-2-hydroxyacid dehydrogenase [Thalassotalea sp. Y01]NMP15228.1 D-2-hydroxyacid dehydrogenase [Thalassotalea sp. Y01]
MRAVFLDKSTINDKIDFSAIESQFDTIGYFDCTDADKVIPRCRFADVIITNKVIIDKQVMAQLPRLKLICIAATGTNNVDLVAAKAQGVTVMNVSGYSTTAVSQYVFAMLLEHLQKSSEYIANVKQGQWQKSPVFCHFSQPFNELAGKTMAIIGYGTIAQRVAIIAEAFGMQVLIAERQGSQSVRSGRTPFEQALAVADVVSLHAPLTAETELMINQQTLAIMKKDAILVNTARGGLVDSNAVVDALKCKQLGAAILDVLEIEPPPANHPLLNNKLKNLYLTAHIAWGSQQAQQRLINGIGKNIADFKSKNRVE